jgi:hypothetical protein
MRCIGAVLITMALAGCGNDSKASSSSGGGAGSGGGDNAPLPKGWFSCDFKAQDVSNNTTGHSCYEAPDLSGAMAKERATSGCDAVNFREGHGYSDTQGCPRNEPGCMCTGSKSIEFFYQQTSWAYADQQCVDAGSTLTCFGGVAYTSQAKPTVKMPVKPNSNGWSCKVNSSMHCTCVQGVGSASGDECTDESKQTGCCFTLEKSPITVYRACECTPPAVGYTCETWLKGTTNTVVDTCPPDGA